MRAFLKVDGKQPDVREELTREVMNGRISGEIAWRSGEGMGSRAQVVGRWESRSCETSESVRGEKSEKQGEMVREGESTG